MLEQRPAMLWTVNRIFAFVIGIVFIVLALLGFLAPVKNGTRVQSLLGILDVDLMHNLIHLVTGVIALIAVFVGQARTFNQAFGIIYLLLGVLGLFPFLYFPQNMYGSNQGLFLGLIHLDAADHVFHIAVGLAAIIVGFFFAGSGTEATLHRNE